VLAGRVGDSLQRESKKQEREGGVVERVRRDSGEGRKEREAARGVRRGRRNKRTKSQHCRR
jgi:hypothetical protein